MKRIWILLVALCLLLGAACDKTPDGANADPNLGLYTATTAEMWGMEMGVGDLFGQGFTIELKANGKCALQVDGKKANGKWTLDGADFTVSGGVDCSGTLSEGVMMLENVLGMGVQLKLVNEAYQAPAANNAGTKDPASSASGGEANPGAQQGGEAMAAQSNEFWIVAYDANGMTYGEDYLKETGMDQTCLTLNDDHTGSLMLMGDSMPIGWTDDGHVTVGNTPLYTFEYVDADTIKLTMLETIFYTLKRGVKSEAVAEPATTETPETDAPATEAPATEVPATEAPASSGTASFPGAPYGDSDGVIDHAKLAGLYRWLSEMPYEFRGELTFDDIGNAVGKQGFDKKDNDGKYQSAYWYDGEKYYVTVTFYNREDRWTCGSISTGIPSSEYNEADISAFPKVGSSTPAGTNPTEQITLETKLKDKVISVIAQVPTVGWVTEAKTGEVRYYSVPRPEKKSSNSPSIRIEFKESLEKIDFYKDKFENLVDLDARTIGGVEMAGRSYKYVGMDWIEFYGEIAEGVWAAVKLTGVDFSAGTETEALVDSIAFSVTQN